MNPTAVGIRELKAHLSRYLKRVQSGATIRVTDRGRTIATIQPVAASERDLAWVRQMVAEGKATWNGGKPKGASRPIRPRPGSKLASDIVIEDRG
jgi:prevent-host-death family protein